MNNLFKYLHNKYFHNPQRWHPILSIYYITNQCIFRCPYCCDGDKTPYYKLDNKILPWEKTKKLLSFLRKNTDYLVITGGEPLLHPDIDKTLRFAKTLSFKEIILNTSGYNIEQHIDSISTSINNLTVSIDTLDQIKADRWLGHEAGTFNEILKNIEEVKNIKHKKFVTYISSVITPHNILDLYEVYDFTAQNGFHLAVCPQLLGREPHHNLINNKEYSDFYNFLIQEKKAGGRIHGSLLYLKYMRDLKKFNCYPSNILAVSPTGDVFYPCLERPQYAGNILESPDISFLAKAGFKRYGYQTSCGRCCHSSCSLNFSLLIDQPFSYLVDMFYWGKTKVTKLF